MPNSAIYLLPVALLFSLALMWSKCENLRQQLVGSNQKVESCRQLSAEAIQLREEIDASLNVAKPQFRSKMAFATALKNQNVPANTQFQETLDRKCEGTDFARWSISNPVTPPLSLPQLVGLVSELNDSPNRIILDELELKPASETPPQTGPEKWLIQSRWFFFKENLQ